jgi:hypothetical protein
MAKGFEGCQIAPKKPCKKADRLTSKLHGWIVIGGKVKKWVVSGVDSQFLLSHSRKE